MPNVINQDEINAILWKACDTFRGTIDPSEYKNYILVMLFLKYISDVWFDHYEQYQHELGDDPERLERRMSREPFKLPRGSDYYSLYEKRNAPSLGEEINMALEAIEEANREKLGSVFRNIDFNSELWSPLVALAAYFEEQGGISGLLEAISDAASWDEQMSEGKALSDREEAVLQALEMITRGEDDVRWIKSATLREQVARLLGQPVEKLGDAQWIGHILKRLHLLDDARRKRGMDGMTYAVQPIEVIDMMRRYDVAVIRET